jgi:MFS family permease
MAKRSGSGIGQVGLIGLAALMVGQSAQGLAFAAFVPGLPQMAQSFNAGGHGMAIAQQCVTIAAFGIIAGFFVSGKIIELIGSRMTLFLALMLFGLAGAGGMCLNDARLLLASRVLVGFAVACLVTACINTISIVFSGNNRSQVIGMSAATASAGSLVGMLVGGVLVQQFGWRTSFIQFPVFAGLSLILVFFGIKDSHADVAHGAGTQAQAGASLWPFYLLAAVISTIMFMGSSQFAFLLPADGVTQATRISVIMAMITVVAVPVSFAFGSIERRLGLNGTLALGFAANTCSLLLLGLVPRPAAAVLGALLMGIYVGISIPFLYQIVAVKAPPEGRARAIGIIGAFNFLGAFLNPFIFAPIATALGIHGTFTAAGIFVAILAVASLMWKF